MAGAEVAGVVELVGRLQREGLDPLQRALGDPGQGAGGRHLEHTGDAEVAHRLQAEVPADRVRDLPHDPLQHVRPVVDDLAVAVADHRRAWVVDRDRAGEPAEPVDRRRHVAGVEGSRDRQRGEPRPGGRVVGQRGELLGGARRDDLARAVVVRGGEPVALQRREDLVPVAAEHGGHPGGRDGGRLGHRQAALADQHHGLLGGHHAGTRRGGELADAVPRDGADLLEGVGGVREELQRRDETGPDQQRLRHLGGADGLGVGLRPVVGEVDASDHGEPLQARGEGGVLQPGAEEPGGLGSLSGGDDDEHAPHSAGPSGHVSLPARTKLSGAPLWGSHKSWTLGARLSVHPRRRPPTAGC